MPEFEPQEMVIYNFWVIKTPPPTLVYNIEYGVSVSHTPNLAEMTATEMSSKLKC